MLREISSYTNKSKSLALLLVFLLAMMGSCSVKKMIASFTNQTVEIVKQPKQNFVAGNSASCSVDVMTVNASLLDFGKTSGNNLFVFFFLVSGLIGFTASLYRSHNNLFSDFKRKVSSPIPLFLKYNTLII